MAIGTPRNLGSALNGNTSSLGLTTTAAVNAGDLVVVFLGAVTARAASSVTDSAGNAYTIIDDTANGTAVQQAMAYCLNATAMASGGTITANWGGGAGGKILCAIAVSGIATVGALDKSGNTASGTGTTETTVSTGVLAQAAELIIGCVSMSGSSAGFAPGGSFTAISGNQSAAGSIKPAYQIVAATTSVSFAPSQTASLAYVTDVVSFKGPTTAYTLTADVGTFTLTGVAAGLRVGRRVAAAPGSFALTGIAAGLRTGRRLVADTGSFALTGVAATLTKTSVSTYTLAAGTGVFTLAGKDATLTKATPATDIPSGGSSFRPSIHRVIVDNRKRPKKLTAQERQAALVEAVKAARPQPADGEPAPLEAAAEALAALEGSLGDLFAMPVLPALPAAPLAALAAEPVPLPVAVNDDEEALLVLLLAM